MGKRKSAVLIDSEDSRSSDSDSDIDKDMLSLAKKGGRGGGAEKKVTVEAFTSSSSSGSDSDSGANSPKKGKKSNKKPRKRSRRSTSGTTQSSGSADERDSDKEPPASDVTSSFISPIPPVFVPPASSSVVSSTVPNNNNETKKTPSDLEEGEVSDDDDQDADDDEEEFTDGYDDNMMGDAEDQRRLSAMTEKEREQEIYMRIEKRDALKGRFEAERKLRRKKKLEAKLAKKGKKLESSTEDSASDAFQMDAKVRSQERKKTVEGKVDKKTQAMDALKASRDAKIQRAQEKEKMRMEQERKREDKEPDDDELELRKDDDTTSSVGDKKVKKLKASDVYSDDSGSEYEEDGANKEKNKSASDSDSRSSDSEDDDRSRKPQFVEKLEDLNRIRVSRFKLEKWLYLPFFPRVLKGCFVRVGVGLPGQKSTYRVCEVVDVTETTRIYQFGNTRTNKGLEVKFGSDKKTFRFEYVSNQSISDEEFLKWKELNEMHGIAMPTLDEISRKEKEIREALDYQLQEEDIEAIITEKAKFKSAPVNFAAKKTQLMKEREIAVTVGDDDRGAEIAVLIQELDERAKELDKLRTSSISSISYINERNRKKNVEEAEKAILEELKSNKGKKVEDPFTRRNTKPRIVSKSVVPNGSENIPGFSTPKLDSVDGLATLETTKLSIEDAVDGLDGSFPIILLDDSDAQKDGEQVGDLFSAHDFDIKLDLDAKLPPNLPIVARPSMTPIKDTAPRRSLNLEEYKRKKGLI